MAPACVGRGYKWTVLSRKHCLAPSGMIHASIQNPSVHVTSKLWLSVEKAAVQWFMSPRLSPHSSSCRGCSSIPDFSSPCGPTFTSSRTEAAVSSVLLLEMEQETKGTSCCCTDSSSSPQEADPNRFDWNASCWGRKEGGRGYRRYHHITVNGASLIVSN